MSGSPLPSFPLPSDGAVAGQEVTSSCVQRLPLPAADPGVFEEGSEVLSLGL